jgi:hypothetical protein
MTFGDYLAVFIFYVMPIGLLAYIGWKSDFAISASKGLRDQRK